MAMAEEEMRKELAASDDSRRPNDGNIFLYYLLQHMDNMQASLNSRIERVETNLNSRIEQVETTLNSRIDRVEANLREEIKTHREETHNMETNLRKENEMRFNKLDSKIDGLEQKMDSTIRWIVGTIVSVAGIAVAVLVWLVD